MASLDDILTTQKNGVVAINGLLQTLQKVYTNFRNVSFSSGPASTSSTTLVSVPTGTIYCVTDIMIVNTGATAATFTINLVKSGDTAGPTNALFYSAPIAPNMSVQWTGNQSIAAGGFVSASATSTSVTFLVNGVAST